MKYLKPNFNVFRPRQNGRRFADEMLKCILLNTIPLYFVPTGLINNILTLVRSRRQAIIRNNDDLITDACMRHAASVSYVKRCLHLYIRQISMFVSASCGSDHLSIRYKVS